APQGQHGGLGLAQMGQMLHDSRPPLVETSLAKHGFPPCGCGLLHIPQYAVGREVISPDFQKTSPCKGGMGRSTCWLSAPAAWDRIPITPMLREVARGMIWPLSHSDTPGGAGSCAVQLSRL